MCDQQGLGSPARRLRRIGAVACVVALAAASAAAKAGGGAHPDRGFGAGRGWVTTRLQGRMLLGYAAAVVAGGKIVIAGQAVAPKANGQVLVVRYRRSGRLDRGFGSRGIFTTSLPVAKGPFVATAVVPQRSTGKLLIAGGYGQGSILLLRLTRDGRLDRSFGAKHNGRAVVSVGGIAQSIAVQRDGKILVGASNANRNGRPMVVARFTDNGLVDRGYGRQGIAQIMFWNPRLAASAGAYALIATADGGVIGAGHLDYIGGDGHGTAGVFKLNPAGRLVKGFGTGGHVQVAFKAIPGKRRQWFPCAATVNSRGAVSVTGDGTLGAGNVLLTARLTRRGRLDRTFGKSHDGRAVTPGAGSSNITTCGASSTAAGVLTVGVGARLIQLRADGAANSAFARGGLIKIAKPFKVTINAIPGVGRSVLPAGSAGKALYLARYVP
jgi:uncharacterized delta-60 repeat protein